MLTVTINRDAAARFGIQPQLIDDTLNDAFGQRQVTQYFTRTIPTSSCWRCCPNLQEDRDTLNQIYVKAPATGQLVPLSTLVDMDTAAHRAVARSRIQGQFPAVTLTFNLPPGVALGQAVDAIKRRQTRSGCRQRCITSFQGNAQAFQASLVERADPDRRRAGRRLCHPRRALRELHPSADDPVDAAVGRRRRAAVPMARRLRSVGDRHYRHHSADRHREEERHHAGRFRHQSRARRALEPRKRRSGRPACCVSVRS